MPARFGLVSVFIFFGFFQSFGQNHVRWEFRFDDSKSEIVLKGYIDEHWHLYSKQTPANSGPVPVEIILNKNKSFRLKGKPREITSPQKLYDQNFESTVYIFENIFESRIKVKPKKNRNVTFDGTITYMVCNDSQCLPPIDKNFKISIP